MADERDAMAADIEHHNDDEAVPCRQGFSARVPVDVDIDGGNGMGGRRGDSLYSLLLMLLIQFDFCR